MKYWTGMVVPVVVASIVAVVVFAMEPYRAVTTIEVQHVLLELIKSGRISLQSSGYVISNPQKISNHKIDIVLFN